MASTTFVDNTTIIYASWLNDVNNGIYNTIPTLSPLVNPTFTTPNLGVASATTINKVAITAPATGATLTIPDGATATVSGTNTGDQLTFKTISVSGQSDVIADSLTDTLTFAAGLGMVITTDASTDTITFLGTSISLTRSVRTSNTILGAADINTLIDITSGTFTQTFTAPATLGSGWFCLIRNSGSGDITIPSSDGVTNWIMYPGESRLFQCNGTVFTSIVQTGYRRDFTSSGTWTKPPGYQVHAGHAWSGGSSGSKGTSAVGGGGGGCWPFNLMASSLGVTETVIIGAGGAAVSVNSTNGVAGGQTAFGSQFVVYGGGGLTSSSLGGAVGFFGGNGYFTQSNPPATGFEGSGATTAVGGGNSVYGGAQSGTAGGGGGKSIYGGGAGGGASSTGAGLSQFGGNGGAGSNTSASASDGTAPGGGGGGCPNTAPLSGAGARGELRIWGIV